jgi:hypothetical protein
MSTIHEAAAALQQPKYTWARPMDAGAFVERHLIRLLILETGASGFVPVCFDDLDGDSTKIKRGSMKATQARVWEAYNAVTGGGVLFFQKPGETGRGALQWVQLREGNGSGLISDYAAGTPSFVAAVERVYLR